MHLREWSMGWRIKFEKNETSLFLITCESARFVIEAADDQSDRTVHEPRMVLHKQSYRPDHGCIFFQSTTQTWYFTSVAVMQFFCATTRWSPFQRDFCSKGNLRLRQGRSRLQATELTCAYQADLKNLDNWTCETQNHLISSLMKQVLQSPNKSTMIDDLIKNSSQKNAEKRLMLPCTSSRFRNVCSTKRYSGTTWCSKDRRSCSMQHLLQISKTRRDILFLWNHSSRHYRGGQEEGRETNQQSIHHVRPWSSQISIEEYSKGSTLWKLCRITKLK